MQDTKLKIIDFIRRNRVSTTEVADCLGKTGVLENVMPINRGHFKVGNVKWVYAHAESNWDVHEQIISTEENDVVFIEAFDCKHRAIIGELVCKYILLYKQASAIICNAKFRDAGALLRENYPIWCTGFTPVGCFNTKPAVALDSDIIEKSKSKYDGAIAVCDDCGVVIIPKEFHTEEFYQKLVHIEEQEDIWFNRLDHYKENTFEIVCLKKYLKK
ncbi:MAG: RraA family protein [Paludibacteraceae bacterium]|nr:RraA family protein [Paludibacteraceae bacterium]